jgi:tRNA U34 5-methylaminomethyl-2-thiouridine-forming methyltransferase MnmC
MQRIPVITKDGSHTISVPDMNVTYHSVHGAIQESMHVFIEAGFIQMALKGTGPINILEIGLGTGLNVLLTATAAAKLKRSIYYVALEPYPLSSAEVHLLNYCELLNREDLNEMYRLMHSCEMNKSIALTEDLLLHKSESSLQIFASGTKFNLIYFDAFAPAAQPELWTKEIFEKLYSLLTEGGILVTYCSKSDVQRAMKTAGFSVEKIPGPRGKREMIRAMKC